MREVERPKARTCCQAGTTRLLVQTGLPHSRRDSLSLVRTNGSLQVSIWAHPLLGLPHGRYPRLLMAWVTTEAVRTKEPALKLGRSLSAFMADLGLLPRGGRHGPIGRVREQMQRLFSATIAFTWDRIEQGRRFRLRRPSEAADFELRVGDLRAFYRVAGDRVEPG